MSDVQFRFYYWGPYLFRSQITPAECKMLLKEGKKSRKKSHDFRSQLAGHLSEEYELKNKEEISEWFEKYILAYTDGYRQWRGREYIPMNSLHAADFWINYMKNNEFNPPHDHGADLSFVIYPEMPKELIKENKNYKGTTVGPGGIAWFYGEGNEQYIDNVTLMPEAGDIFIFPSALKHWVFPFKSKVERISVSGNISFRRKDE